ncbi:hypothetical protein [Brevibacillus reuszeri]|uniref:hypothetical protein n=1 Tax=Brevibacillus reuszeri TaxID=54915 RepID=UPI000CCBE3B9|nr:hypothetical protein [Brevibacillus reuszeri]
MRKKVFNSLLVLSLLVPTVFGSVVYGQEETKIDRNTLEKRKEIEKIIIESEIKAREYAKDKLKEQKGKTAEDYEGSSEFIEILLEKEKDILSEYDIQRIDEATINEDGGISIQSTSPPTNAIDLGSPKVYSSSQGYLIVSSVYWKNEYWRKHLPVTSGSPAKMGGADGLGIFFNDSTNIEISSSSFYTYDESLKTYNNNLYPHRIGGSGVYYKAQDTVNVLWPNANSYSWDSSYITVWPYFKGRVNTTARTQFTHTWGDTDISSVTIGNGYIGVTFSNPGYEWDGYSSGYAQINN